tara:strand:+ start:635 stop:1150 length:516 start_codon:yes stop_codon:yes gene_type:complete
MLRAKLFSRFLKNKKTTNSKIVKSNFNQKFDLQDQINNEIIKIDQEISENSKALLEAQIVKIRSSFSTSKNFIEKVSQNVYKKKLDESITWHQTQLKELSFRRRELQINLEKMKGIFWINRIKRFITVIFIGFLILLSLFIFLSGFMVIIYLLPLIILILFGYYLLTIRKH